MAVCNGCKPWRILCRLLLAIYGSRLCRWRHEFSMDGFGYADDGTGKVTTIGSLSVKPLGSILILSGLSVVAFTII